MRAKVASPSRVRHDARVTGRRLFFPLSARSSPPPSLRGAGRRSNLRPVHIKRPGFIRWPSSCLTLRVRNDGSCSTINQLPHQVSISFCPFNNPSLVYALQSSLHFSQLPLCTLGEDGIRLRCLPIFVAFRRSYGLNVSDCRIFSWG